MKEKLVRHSMKTGRGETGSEACRQFLPVAWVPILSWPFTSWGILGKLLHLPAYSDVLLIPALLTNLTGFVPSANVYQEFLCGRNS